MKFSRMAAIPEETQRRIWHNCHELINIANATKFAEYKIFAEYGDNSETEIALDSLQNVVEEVQNQYQRLTGTAIRVALAQPQADAGTVTILENALNNVETRISAWLRSIEEIVNDCRLYE